ncbi:MULTISPECIES: hypothetical protein [unclassified Crossiella]|uniref:hypothetical protein n=1 Tax=unclassified Crossiella TaxID=2620835 RepID=UPI001FFE8F66|nr:MULTISPECIES: hypothetical protein [unclassified Crossiella]MCK2243523.1 hypothetical protein [Crossiella sp. S99.2]MCK2257381.1 hypothetical protein [Crossiella sp. S99.1]
MQLGRKILVSAAAVAATMSSTLVLLATPASAEVWRCEAKAEKAANYGQVFCRDGFGSYRVVVECNMGHWPYTRNIDGPLVTKQNGYTGPISRVDGPPNGCHVVKAWLKVV